MPSTRPSPPLPRSSSSCRGRRVGPGLAPRVFWKEASGLGWDRPGSLEPSQRRKPDGLVGSRTRACGTSPREGAAAILSPEAREGAGTPCPPAATPQPPCSSSSGGRGGTAIDCRSQDRRGLVCSGEVHRPDARGSCTRRTGTPSGPFPFTPAQHGTLPSALDGPGLTPTAQQSAWRIPGEEGLPSGLAPREAGARARLGHGKPENMRLRQKAEPVALPGPVGRVPA